MISFDVISYLKLSRSRQSGLPSAVSACRQVSPCRPRKHRYWKTSSGMVWGESEPQAPECASRRRASIPPRWLLHRMSASPWLLHRAGTTEPPSAMQRTPTPCPPTSESRADSRFRLSPVFSANQLHLFLRLGNSLADTQILARPRANFLDTKLPTSLFTCPRRLI